MFEARSGWFLAGAFSLCMLARAEDSTRPPGQMAPPKRIPEAVSDGMMENLQPTGEPVNTDHDMRRCGITPFHVADAVKAARRQSQKRFARHRHHMPRPIAADFTLEPSRCCACFAWNKGRVWLVYAQ